MCKEIESPVVQTSLRDRCLHSKTRFYNEERRTGWQHCLFYSASRFLKSDTARRLVKFRVRKSFEFLQDPNETNIIFLVPLIGEHPSTAL
jgi:hypothetical protein